MSIRFKTIRVQADQKNVGIGVRESRLPAAIDSAVNEFLESVPDAEYLHHDMSANFGGTIESAIITIVYKSDKPFEAPRRGRPPAK